MGRSGGTSRIAHKVKAVGPPDSLYFNSNEVTDARSVLTDDFRRGNWYTVDSDHTDWTTVAPGWGGTIFANPITPAGAVRNLAALGKKPLFTGSDYAATTGFIDGVDGGVLPARNHAWHSLSGGGSGGYDEIYCRFYTFYVPANYWGASDPAANYTWGAQKGGTFNRFNDSGGIFWAGLGYNVGMGRPDPNTTTGFLAITNNHGPNNVIPQNLTAIGFAPGNWYYVEVRIKLNSVGNSDGIFEMWINNGGSTGDFSGQSPIKRANHTNIDWGRTGSDTQLLGVFWPENWSNPASIGEQLWANIHVKAGAGSQVGFAA